jgi:hypothetical protein
MSESSSSLAELVGRMPDPDGRGMYCTEIDLEKGSPEGTIVKEKIEAAIAEIHKGGRNNIIGLIDMLVEPGKGDDVKPHYALHCLGLHVCRLGGRAKRRFTRTLASELGGDRPKAVQSYLVQELGAVGGPEAVEALGGLLSDKELCEPAAMALAAIGEGAGEQLRGGLSRATGKCKLNIVQNLGVLRDRRSVGALRKELTDKSREMRLAAAWALANIADPGSVDAVVAEADTKDGYERIKATQACLLLAERLLADGNKRAATMIYSHLRNTRSDASEKYVREAAEKALSAAR